MKVRLVTSLRDFDNLAPMWGQVTEESGQRSPFLSHDWFACCWRTAGPNRRREVWVMEDSAGPVAMLPLVRYTTTVRGLPVRMLQFMDAPDTPFADVPVARAPENTLGALLKVLRERSDWDLLSFVKMPVASRTFKTLGGALPGQFPWRVARVEQSPYVEIAGTWEEYFRGKSQRFRKTCRNIENRIQKTGSVEVEEHTKVAPDAPVFSEVLDVSRQSWKGTRGVAMATMQGMPRFFRELTLRASMNGWLHLWLLRLDGRAVAAEYQIGANGYRHALRADFDSALGDLSPGAYLNMAIIRSLFERSQVREYDMGPGSNEYKLRWATGTRESVALEVYAPTTYGRLLHAIETRVVPLARRVRNGVKGRCA